MTVPTLTAHRFGPPAPQLPLLLLGPSLGTTTSLWEPVAEQLAGRADCVAWDLPGHGASPPAREPFTVAELATAVLDLADQQQEQRGDGGAPFLHAGDSIGGATGLELALLSPRLAGLATVCTGAVVGEPAGWHERAALVRAEGTRAVVPGSRERWFGPGFLERDPAAAEALLATLAEVDAESYARACEALARYDMRDRLADITVPTVVVSGEADVATPPERGAEIASGVAAAELLVLPGVGHLAPVEAPDAVAAAVRGLLERVRAVTPGQP